MVSVGTMRMRRRVLRLKPRACRCHGRVALKKMFLQLVKNPNKMPSAWITHVKAVYAAGKKKNASYKYGQAMKDAKSTYKRAGKAASNAVEEKAAPKKRRRKKKSQMKESE